LPQTSHQEEQLKPRGENLQNVHDVVLYLQKAMGQFHVAYEGAKKDVKWVFWEVKIRDVDRIQGFDYKNNARISTYAFNASSQCTKNVLLEVKGFLLLFSPLHRYYIRKLYFKGLR
jgi:hypothetical protein